MLVHARVQVTWFETSATVVISVLMTRSANALFLCTTTGNAKSMGLRDSFGQIKSPNNDENDLHIISVEQWHQNCPVPPVLAGERAYPVDIILGQVSGRSRHIRIILVCCLVCLPMRMSLSHRFHGSFSRHAYAARAHKTHLRLPNSTSRPSCRAFQQCGCYVHRLGSDYWIRNTSSPLQLLYSLKLSANCIVLL